MISGGESPEGRARGYCFILPHEADARVFFFFLPFPAQRVPVPGPARDMERSGPARNWKRAGGGRAWFCWQRERRFSTRTGWLNCHVRYCSNHPVLAAHFQVHAPNHRARFFCPVQCRRTRTLGSGIAMEEGEGGRGGEAVAHRRRRLGRDR